MWLMLNDCFLSIVSKDCARDELLVRARRQGDIEKVFPKAKIIAKARTDYLYRAVIKRTVVEQAMIGELRRVTYSNFKDSVVDDPLHDAYLKVWLEMAKLQPIAPYSAVIKAAQVSHKPDFDSFLLTEKDIADYHAGVPGPYAKSFKNEDKARGGRARAAKMTPTARSAAARHAANCRWGKLSRKGD